MDHTHAAPDPAVPFAPKERFAVSTLGAPGRTLEEVVPLLQTFGAGWIELRAGDGQPADAQAPTAPASPPPSCGTCCTPGGWANRWRPPGCTWPPGCARVAGGCSSRTSAPPGTRSRSGEGALPLERALERALELLARSGYPGPLGLEWEREGLAPLRPRARGRARGRRTPAAFALSPGRPARCPVYTWNTGRAPEAAVRVRTPRPGARCAGDRTCRTAGAAGGARCAPPTPLP